MEKDCVFIKEDEKGLYCDACKHFYCDNEFCSFCKTKEDIEVEEKAKEIREKVKKNKNLQGKKYCRFWDSRYRSCTILKAPYCCVEEECSFYKPADGFMRFVDVEKTSNKGWKETGKRFTNFKMD